MAKRIKSGLKRVEVAERNRQRNIAVKSEMKTRIKQADATLIPAAAVSDRAPALITAISSIDRAAKKGVIHKNRAARLKSRLTKRVNAAAIAQ
jgi:small subunit ribosomal protein S20